MRYALWGVFGTRNFGNEATLSAVLDSLPRFDRDATLIIVAAQPEQAEREHRIDAVPISPDPDLGLPTQCRVPFIFRFWRELKDVWRVRRDLQSVDVLVIAGTGIIYERDGGIFSLPFQLYKWTSVAHWMGKSVVFLSVGADGLTGERRKMPIRSRVRERISVHFLRRSLEKAHYRSYRDRLSRARVAALIPSASLDPVCPDLAFGLNVESAQQRAPEGRSPLIVGLGLYEVEGSAVSRELYLAMIDRLIFRLAERGHQVRLLIGDALYDPKIVDAVCASVARSGRQHVRQTDIADFTGLLEELADCDLIIATRFHNLLLAMVLHKPVISISHFDKNDQLMSSMGVADCSIPLVTANAEHVMRCINDLEGRMLEVVERFRSSVQASRRQLDKQYALVVEVAGARIA
jgi:polysaccharide pyruvyl transferase WcaK-like protein